MQPREKLDLEKIYLNIIDENTLRIKRKYYINKQAKICIKLFREKKRNSNDAKSMEISNYYIYWEIRNLYRGLLHFVKVRIQKNAEIILPEIYKRMKFK